MNYIYRQEHFGGLLYDIDNSLIYYSQKKSSSLKSLKSKDFELQKTNCNKTLEENYFENHVGKYIKNSPLNKTISAPITLFLEVTGKCNLRCKHCLNNSGGKFENELTLQEIKKLIKEISNIGVFNIKISGGEPFARKDIFDILSILEREQINFTVYTNGLLLTDKSIKFLKNLKHLQKIRISIDGNEEVNDQIRGKGTYKKSTRLLKKLCLNNIPCELNYTITSTNYNMLENISKNLKNLNINCKINIGMVKISGRTAKGKEYYCVGEEINKCICSIQKQLGSCSNVKSFYELKSIYYKLFSNKFGCPAAKTSATIKSNGDVFACGMFFDKENYLCGNVKKQTFINIWNGKSMELFRNIKENEKCLNCNFYKTKCTGACRGNAFNITGDLSGDDINCDYYKADFNAIRDTKIQKI